MRAGVVTWWFNRGQATVGRHLRSALDALGHESFVLARPAPDRFVRPRFVDDRDVWAQERITVASAHDVPREELLGWAQQNRLDAVLFFQNYRFDDVAALRDRGVATLGCFMWEAFGAEHVEGTRRAYDAVYSLNRCSHERYRALGVDSRLLGWGCHPELVAHRWAPPPGPPTTFLFPGGYMYPRKPIRPVLEAFAALEDPDARLVLKLQSERGAGEGFEDLLAADPRVTLHVDDAELDRYYDLLTSAHVLVAPARWEGLGLHLYEALAFGLPAIANDDPPMNEVLGDGGRLVASLPAGTAPSGIPARDPEVPALTRALRELTRPNAREELSHRARRRAGELGWDGVVERLGALLGEVA